MVQTYFIVQLIYWQKNSDHQDNLKKKETIEKWSNSYLILLFSQQAPFFSSKKQKQKSGQKGSI